MTLERYVLYSDYDHTLTTTDQGLLEENRRGIEQFIELGGKFALGSGRNIRKFRETGLPANVPLILRNGAQIYDPLKQEYIKQYHLEDSVIDLMKDLYEKEPDVGLLVHLSEETMTYRQFAGGDPLVGMNPVTDFSDIDSHRGAIIMASVLGNREDLERIMPYINETHPELGTVYGSSWIIDIIRPGMSKGLALKYIKENFLQDKIVIAAGDGDNDVTMLKEADIACVVANGTPAALQEADVVFEKASVPLMPQLIRWLKEKENEE